jgi:adenosylcobinamide-phosphate synthase
MSLAVQLGCLLVALAVDWAVGDPPWLWRRLPHPVVLLGALVGRLDRALNRDDDSPRTRRLKGIAALEILLVVAFLAGTLLHGLARVAPFGILIEILVIAVLIAQRDLADHVRAVADALVGEGLAGGRRAVSRIVGRDPDSLDDPGVCRAAIESLAENFADGVVAPVLWYALLGLPGLLAYKALNTADSMIGHRTDRHRDFGWAVARADDLANFPASRLSALLITTAAMVTLGRASARAGIEAVHGSAKRHRSPNAGWPEAAMAGALGVALAGPRRYGAELVDDAWMNPAGRRDLDAADIGRALSLFRISCLLLAGLVAFLFILTLAAGV